MFKLSLYAAPFLNKFADDFSSLGMLKTFATLKSMNITAINQCKIVGFKQT